MRDVPNANLPPYIRAPSAIATFIAGGYKIPIDPKNYEENRRLDIRGGLPGNERSHPGCGADSCLQ